jgi:hypothetical protein
MEKQKMNEAEAKFVKELIGKKVGFQVGARPVGAVDEKQMVIHDVAVCIQGEALGHGLWLDEAFIRAVIEQGNAAEKGLLCHFGHETPNANRIKNYMGAFSNFVEKPAKSHDGEDVIGAYADIKFSKVAKEMSDNVAWVLGLARERPDALGLSIVFDIGDYKVKTADGELLYSEAMKDVKNFDEGCVAYDKFFEASVDGKLYAVMGTLHGADFVAEGAATDGLFAVGEGENPLKKLQAAAETPAETPAETAQPSEEEQQEAATEEPAAQAPAESEELSRVRAEYEKRLSGFQSMHDKKIAEFNGRIESLQKELAAAKDSASAFEKKLGAKELELVSVRERLSVAEDAHRKLTGGALTVGDAPAAAKSMSEFLADHGGDFSAAVKADPETYKRICAANGWQPVALINK